MKTLFQFIQKNKIFFGKKISDFLSYFVILNVFFTIPISMITLIILNSYYESLISAAHENLLARSKAFSASLENSIKDRVYPSKNSSEYVDMKSTPLLDPLNDYDELNIFWKEDKPYFLYKRVANQEVQEWIFHAEFLIDKILDSDMVRPDEKVIIMNPTSGTGISDSIEDGFRITEEMQSILDSPAHNNLITTLRDQGKGEIVSASRMPSLPFQLIILKSKSVIYSVVRGNLFKFLASFFLVFLFISFVSFYLAKTLSARRKEESKLKSLLKNLPLGACLINPNFELIVQNSIMSDINHEDPELWKRLIREAQFRVQTTNQSISSHVWEIQQGKNWEITLTPWFDDSTQPEGYSLVLRDLTAKKLIFEHEMEMARKIQKDYLPADSETFNGIHFKVFYKPYLQVGGDYYDFLHLDKNRYLFVMADVIGHGLQAAMMMTVVKVLFLQIASTHTDPKQILEKINDAVRESLPPGKNIVPLHFLILNTDTKTFQYANAGHPGMIFLSDKSKDNVQVFSRLNTVLGFYSGWSAEIIEGNYGKNSRFFLYTDGLTDVHQDPSELLGEQGVMDFFMEHKELSPEKFTHALEEQIMEYAGGTPFPDDITWFVIDSE